MKSFRLIFLLGLLIVCSIPDLFARSTELPAIYMIKHKESLEDIAVKLLPKNKIKYGKRIEDLKEDLKDWNPHITNWNEIPLDSNIYIENPYPVFISFPYAEKLQAGKNYTLVNTDAESPLDNKNFTVFAAYTASAGTFQENLTAVSGTIQSTQNSTFSLGLGTTIFLDKTNKMLSASVYWSSLQASTLSGTDISSGEIKGVPEYGFNIYYSQLTSLSDISLYGGIDFERFSTFNTTDFINGAELAYYQNKITFATFGAGKTFHMGGMKIQTKTSIAQTVISETSSLNSIDKFSGQRFLFFTSLKGDSRFTYHFLYKRHMLEGPTKLTINRIGFGLGLVLF